jgi:hypothetical protein
MIVPYKGLPYRFVSSTRTRRRARSDEKSLQTGLKTMIPALGLALAGWCFSCSLRHMETHKWLQRVALLVLVLLMAVPAQAQRLQRVRGDTDDVRRLLRSGLQRSPTFRAIVDRLEASDLIVEVQCGRLKSTLLAGSTVLLTAQPSVRYVLVEFACPRSEPSALAILGHELRHALEIASAPWVADELSLEKLYTQIGFLNCLQTGGFGDFETADALEAGERVHHELFHPAASTRRVAQVMTK